MNQEQEENLNMDSLHEEIHRPSEKKRAPIAWKFDWETIKSLTLAFAFIALGIAIGITYENGMLPNAVLAIDNSMTRGVQRVKTAFLVLLE